MRVNTVTPTVKEMGQKNGQKSTVSKGIFGFFDHELEQKNNDINVYEHEITELRNKIESAGSRLQEEPTVPRFKEFRDLLSSLAKKITTEAYRLEKIGGNAHNPRPSEIITIINNEADRLYDLIIKENRDNMAITEKVIGIKGLVVDLLT